MKIYTLDFETYYASDYSLSQREMTIDRYVHDERFKEHLLGIRWPDGRRDWVAGPEIDAALDEIPWEQAGILCHHTAFDGYILSARHGRVPRFYLDTLSMGRALYGHETGVSLDKLAQHLHLPPKGTDLVLTRGVRDLSPELMRKLGAYCLTDVDITWQAFCIMREVFPVAELWLIDLTVRMFTDPVFDLDARQLRQFKGRLAYEKNELFNRLGISADMLRSDQKFATVLAGIGVEPGTKINKKGEVKYAFAKADPFIKVLLEHEQDEVRWLAEARIGAKSTTDETRCERLLTIAEAGRRWPIYLNYYGAQGTGRWSGGGKANPQNLRRGGTLRKAVVAPDGHVVLASDSSQIEARMLAYVAGQEDLVEKFRNKADIYSEFATLIYDRPIDRKRKENPDIAEGFVGKTCIAEGTLVLCKRGYVTIERLTVNDEVWDGGNWVCHKGVVCNGIKTTLPLCGAWLTPDHLVLSGTQWKDAASLANDEHTLCQALATAAENLPLQATSKEPAAASLRSSSGATAATTNTRSTRATSRRSVLRAATYALRKLRARSVTGSTQQQCLTTSTAPDYLTASLQQSPAATVQPAESISTTAGGALASVRRGGPTARRFFGMCRRLTAGITRRCRWTAPTSTETMSRATSGSSPPPTTCVTNDESQTLRRSLRVYDVLSAGPHNRFTILTERGPLVVHNCILGLGYGVGDKKLQATLAAGINGPAVHLPLSECARIVYDVYRPRMHRIVDLWEVMEQVLAHVAAGREWDHPSGTFSCSGDGIHLPNGMTIRYPDLRWERFEVPDNEQLGQTKLKWGWRYQRKKVRDTIFGTKAAENLTQALSRIVVSTQMLHIERHYREMRREDPARIYRIGTMSHDEVVSVIPQDRADEIMARNLKLMSVPPKWAPGFPVTAEAGYARTYGDAKK